MSADRSIDTSLAATVQGVRNPYYCYECGRIRELCEPFDGTCDAVNRSAAEYRAERGSWLPLFNIKRLQNENEAGVTQQEIHKDIIESAIADGREDQIGLKR